LQRRSDAERNRQAILAAFTDLLASDGADVPMYRVAQQAGVGQATLYRHFPDRTHLAIAVYDQRLDRLAELAAARAAEPRAFLDLVQELVLEEARTPGLLRELRGGAEGRRYLRRLTGKALKLLEGPLREARAAGIVRGDLRLDDVQIMFGMIEGAIQEADLARRPRIALRALELLLLGVAEPGTWPPVRRGRHPKV
jgi:AcrR family transcriptional regulator